MDRQARSGGSGRSSHSGHQVVRQAVATLARLAAGLWLASGSTWLATVGIGLQTGVLRGAPAGDLVFLLALPLGFVLMSMWLWIKPTSKAAAFASACAASILAVIGLLTLPSVSADLGQSVVTALAMAAALVSFLAVVETHRPGTVPVITNRARFLTIAAVLALVGATAFAIFPRDPGPCSYPGVTVHPPAGGCIIVDTLLLQGGLEQVELAVSRYDGTVVQSVSDYHAVYFPVGGNLNELDRIHASLTAEGFRVMYSYPIELFASS